jgi:alpha-mannosidase
MNLEELIVLLPCYSLEDLSLDRDAREADELLSAWSALFHPSLVQAAGAIPKWVRADDPPGQLDGKLVVVPSCSEALLPEDWPDSADTPQALVLRRLRHRDQILSAALKTLGDGRSPLEPELCGDFLSLGFCHFQVELLTRQLRYMSNLDEVGFERAVLSASEAAVGADSEAAREHLRSAFDLLTEAREYFYPVETYLLDLTLLAPTVLGPSLCRELAEGSSLNLLVSGQVLEEMGTKEPDTLAALRDAVEAERATIIGGDFDEKELPLLPPEAILASLQRGLAACDQHLGRRPSIFGRRRYGLTPLLPQILKKLGFAGALHFTLDAGRFPTGNQSKVRWEGIDSTTVEALGRIPLDASKADSFLNLPEKLGDTMDLDHAATAIFAHWPARASPWYEDLRRMAAYSPVLGRFVTMDAYFRDTEYVGQNSKYSADQYRSPYLRQAVASGEQDPLTRWVRYYGRFAAAHSLDGLRFLGELAGGELLSKATKVSQNAALDARFGDAVAGVDRDRPYGSELEQPARDFALSLTEVPGTGPKGCLLINPWLFPRQTLADVSMLDDLPAVGGSVRCAAECGGRKRVVVDVPAMGFAWVGPAASDTPPSEPKRAKKRGRKKKEELGLADQYVLRNEYYEATVNPITGAIQAIHDYATRGSRLTQQIAFRFPVESRPKQEVFGGGDEEKHYSVMAADEVVVTVSDRLCGEILAKGRLLDRNGRSVASFSQTARVVRGSRVLELDIELDAQGQPGPDPWTSYYAVRLAWGDATADLYRGVNQLGVFTDTPQIESPYYVDIRGEKTRTTILAGGLPYHRRIGLRKLDTLLIVRGETGRSFRLGIGIDLDHPMAAAMDFLAPQSALVESPAPVSAHSGWLFHLAARAVIATHWQPIREGRRLIGFRVRLLETEGRRVRTHLRACRAVRRARKVDFTDQELAALNAEEDRIDLEFGPYEWVQVEADFV